MDIRFYSGADDELPVDDDGVEARLDNEFLGWKIRWIGPDRGPPFIRFGEAIIALVPEGDAYVTPKSKKAKPIGTGLVSLFADSEGVHPLLPWLRANPANLPQEVYQHLLADLRDIAFELSFFLSPTERKAPAVNVGERDTASILQRWIAAGRAAVECAEVVLRQLPLISRHPARRLIRSVGVVDRERALRQGAAGLLLRLPEYQRRLLMPVLQETRDTTELRFILQVIAELLEDTDLLERQLRARLGVAAEATVERNAGRHRYRQSNLATPVTFTGPATTMESNLLMGALASAKGQLARAGMGPQAPTRWSGRMTNRLMLSKEYGPVATAWAEYRHHVPLEAVNYELLDQLDEANLADTPVLFERWVAVKLYAGLVDRGFRPPNGEPSLMDAIKVADGHLLIGGRHGSSLRLRRDVHGAEVELKIDFDVYRKDLDIRPDVLITCTHQERACVWVFDAKYKDYRRPVPAYQRKKEEKKGRQYADHFRSDLEGVAEETYRRPLAAMVGGILHSDLHPEYTEWDPGPRRLSPGPHSLVSAPLLPGEIGDRNITTLLRLLFGYHLGLADICWRCGADGVLVSTDERRVRSQGRAYECAGCGGFWIDHWCKGRKGPGGWQCGERLLKYGTASFHRTEVDDPFNVHCPKCGEYFRREDNAAETIGATGWVYDEEPF